MIILGCFRGITILGNPHIFLGIPDLAIFPSQGSFPEDPWIPPKKTNQPPWLRGSERNLGVPPSNAWRWDRMDVPGEGGICKDQWLSNIYSPEDFHILPHNSLQVDGSKISFQIPKWGEFVGSMLIFRGVFHL